MDTLRDKKKLNEIYNSKKAPWVFGLIDVCNIYRGKNIINRTHWL